MLRHPRILVRRCDFDEAVRILVGFGSETTLFRRPVTQAVAVQPGADLLSERAHGEDGCGCVGVVLWTDAADTDAAGSEASPIQSSGMTNRAKTLPLSPLPPTVFLAGANSPLSAAADPPDAGVVAGIESARFATAFEPVRPARA